MTTPVLLGVKALTQTGEPALVPSVVSIAPTVITAQGDGTYLSTKPVKYSTGGGTKIIQLVAGYYTFTFSDSGFPPVAYFNVPNQVDTIDIPTLFASCQFDPTDLQPVPDAPTVGAELALKAPLASPVFTGTPTAPTPAPGDDSTAIATTAFVQGAIPPVRINVLPDPEMATVSNWAAVPGTGGTANVSITPFTLLPGVDTMATVTWTAAQTSNSTAGLQCQPTGAGVFSEPYTGEFAVSAYVQASITQTVGITIQSYDGSGNLLGSSTTSGIIPANTWSQSTASTYLSAASSVRVSVLATTSTPWPSGATLNVALMIGEEASVNGDWFDGYNPNIEGGNTYTAAWQGTPGASASSLYAAFAVDPNAVVSTDGFENGELIVGIGAAAYSMLPAPTSNGQVLVANNHTGGGMNWASVPGGAWGSITGTLSSQTDLNTALAAKAPLASPTFTGTPAAPTPTAGDSTTKVATTAFVGTAVSGSIGAAGSSGKALSATDSTTTNSRTPSGTAGGNLSGTYPNPTVAAVNGVTISGTPSANQVPVASSGTAAAWAAAPSSPPNGAASGDLSGTYPSPSVAKIAGVAVSGTPSSGQVITATSGTAASWTTPTPAPVTSVAGRTGAVVLGESDITNLTTDLAAKAPLASPALTGTPTVPTAAGGTSTTQAASTAFVASAISPLAPLASPALTGSPTAPTQAATDTSTKLATTAFVGAAAVPSATVTASGDLIVGTGAGTVSRLGVGANGTSLTVVSGVPAWAQVSGTASTMSGVSGTLNLGGATPDETIEVTLTGNVTVVTLPTWTSSQSGSLTIAYIQDSTGGRTLTQTGVRWASGTLPTLSTAPLAMDIITYWWTGARWIGVITGTAFRDPTITDTWFLDDVPSLSSLTSYDFGTSGFIEAFSFTVSAATQEISAARYGAPAGLAGASLQFVIQTGTSTARTTVATSSTVTVASGWNEATFSTPFAPSTGTTYWCEAVITGTGPHLYSSTGDAGQSSADGIFTMSSGTNRWYTTSPTNVTGSLTSTSETIPIQLGYQPVPGYSYYPSDSGLISIPSGLSSNSNSYTDFETLYSVTANKSIQITGLRMYFATAGSPVTGYLLTGTSSSRTIVATSTTVNSVANGWVYLPFSSNYHLSSGSALWIGAMIAPSSQYYYDTGQNFMSTSTPSDAGLAYDGAALYAWNGGLGALTGTATSWGGWNALDVIWE